MTARIRTRPAHSLTLKILNHEILLRCDDPIAARCLSANFAAMAMDESVAVAHPRITYSVRTGHDSYSLTRSGKRRVEVANPGDLLYAIEKDLTVWLQRRRPDLYFLHAAVVEWHGRAIVLAADSGRGKSTTAWALLHHGFGYLSDELGPVDVGTLLVHPYPHALCLKQAPPDPSYALPEAALHLGRTIHVPVSHLPSRHCNEPLPLGAVLLVGHAPDLGRRPSAA